MDTPGALVTGPATDAAPSPNWRARVVSLASRHGWRRAGISLTIGAVCGLASWSFWSEPRIRPSDFAQLWAAAGALLEGTDPYSVVGPGRQFEWDFPLLYPMTAVLSAVPFAVFSLHMADALFVGIGAAALAWALTRKHLNNPQLCVFASIAYLYVVQTSQWGPWLVAAALTPGLGFILAAKPTIGLALLAAYPRVGTVIGMGAFAALSLAIWPSWPIAWLEAIPAGTHIMAPVTQWAGGPLILLALARWRRPEARLLALLACVPHTPDLYEAIPLFLVPLVIEEAVLLSALTFVMLVVRENLKPFETYEAWMATSSILMVWLLYLPCVVMVLLRPNTWDEAPAKLTRAADYSDVSDGT